MEPELWHRIEELFERALEMEERLRAKFLKDSCGDDEVLRREVESLLAHEKRAEHFIESSPLEVMSKQIAQEQGRAGSGITLIGTTVSHYRVLEKLGEGGMGVV